LNISLASPVQLTIDITSSIPFLQCSKFTYIMKSTVVLIESDKRNSWVEQNTLLLLLLTRSVSRL
jgi:hypothetical protein